MSIYEDGLAQGRKEGVEAVKAIWERWEDLARDRDEWKTQHENLLAMYQTAIATIHALKCRISDAQQEQPSVIAAAEAMREAAAKICGMPVHDAGHPGTAFKVQGMCIDAIRALSVDEVLKLVNAQQASLQGENG